MAGYQPIQDTSPAALAQMNKMVAQLNHEQQTKVFKQAGGKNAVIQGKLPGNLGYGTILYDTSGIPLIYMAVDADNTPILKVAKTGKDATTAPNGDLIFNSAQNVLKIAKTDTATIAANSTPGTSVTTTVDTGVSATDLRAFSAFIETSGARVPLPHTIIDLAAGTIDTHWWVQTQIVGSQVRLIFSCEYVSGFAPPAVAVRYYIFQETAQ